jgi:LPXTG-motif cell wall-anchored protein
MESMEANVVAYTINNQPNGESAKAICVIHNANPNEVKVKLPDGNWDVYINDEVAGTKVIETINGEATVKGISSLVMVQKDETEESDKILESDKTTDADQTVETLSPNRADNQDKEAKHSTSDNWVTVIGIAGIAVIAGIIGVVIYRRRNKGNKN